MSECAVTVAVDAIARRILTLRRQRVIVDADLAARYGVETRRLDELVKRNVERRPAEFMFQLTSQEVAPVVFTERGAIAATVNSSPRAVEVSIYVVGAFVRLREALAGHKELAAKLGELERKLKGHDQAIAGILDAIRQLTAPPAATGKRPIGFMTGTEKK